MGIVLSLLIVFTSLSATAQHAVLAVLACSALLSNAPEPHEGKGRLGDFDGDGYVDVVTYGERVAIQYGRSNGTLEPPVTIAGKADQLLAGDFNGDGRIDFVFSRAVAQQLLYRFDIFLIEATGDRSYAEPRAVFHKIARGHDLLGVADFIGDELPEILVSNETSLELVHRKSNNEYGAMPVAGTAKTEIWLPSILVGTADVNADGKLDLIRELLPRQGIHVLRGDGEGRFARSYKIGDRDNGRVITADLNDDGHADVLTFDRFTGLIELFLGPLGAGAAPYASIPTSAPLIDAIANDFNGDGTIDVVGNTGTTLLTFANDGRGNLTLIAESGPNRYSGPMTAGDLHRDGAIDLMIGSFVVRGNGDGTFRTPRQLNPRGVKMGLPLAALDVDGDGVDEVITSFAQIARIGPTGLAAFESIREKSEEIAMAVGDAHAAPGIEVVTYDSSSKQLHAYSRSNNEWQRVSSHAIAKQPHAVTATQGRIAFIIDARLFVTDAASVLTIADLKILYAPDDNRNEFGIRASDLDRDGREELIVRYAGGDTRFDGPTLHYEGNVQLFRGLGGARFAPAEEILADGSGVDDVVVGDFNADGHRDLVISVQHFLNNPPRYEGIFFFAGRGDGTFEEKALLTDWPYAKIAMGDANGDGVDDLAVNAQNGLSLFLGTPGGLVLFDTWATGGIYEWTLWPLSRPLVIARTRQGRSIVTVWDEYWRADLIALDLRCGGRRRTARR